jgi:1,4-dihydroxy-6-naphthoate synthase
MAYALKFGRGIEAGLADRFVDMYVNDLTQELGGEGREAVAELLRRAEASGAYEAPVRVEFAP